MFECTRIPALVLAFLGPASLSAQPSTPDALLAKELARATRETMAAEPLLVEDIRAAVVLIEEALALQPDAADLWRLMVQVASIAERDDLRAKGVREIVRLDPSDEVARWMRLRSAVDRYQIVDERIGAYERLLDPAIRDRVGDAVASRLAMDLALLQKRTGDEEAFGRWLAEATIIDPANREAAALAAGFYGIENEDPFAEAELLVNLLLANPTDLSAHTTLLTLLLRHGAYEGAARVGTWVRTGAEADGAWIDDDLMAQLAIATWGKGDASLAARLIERRYALLDAEQRQAAARDSATPLANEPAQLRAPRNAAIFTLVAAIHHANADSRLEAALAEAFEANQAALAASEEAGDTDTQARLLLEQAWVNVWLGEDAASAQPLLEQAHALRPLNDAARKRFEGWRLLREDRLAEAIEIFAPLADSDAATRLGLAVARVQQGDSRDGARELLALARTNPGTIIGVWATQRLGELLGRQMSISQNSQRLDELVRSMPRAMEEYLTDDSVAVGVRVYPVSRTVEPFEPVWIEIEISNESVLPLAVDPEGPIRSQVVAFPRVDLLGGTPDDPLDAMVIDLDRVLRLMPQERHLLRVDLRQYEAGRRLKSKPLAGASIGLTVMSNFQISPGGTLMAGLFGASSSTPQTRVNGVRITNDWIIARIAALNAPGPPPPRDVALLAHAVIAPERSGVDPDPERKDLIGEARAAVMSAYPRLNPVSRAWVLSVLPHDATFDPILSMARKSHQRLVVLMYLLEHRSGPDDPMLDAAMRGDDEVIRVVAEMLRATREDPAPPDGPLGDAPATRPDDTP